jgi:hypothetical protein
VESRVTVSPIVDRDVAMSCTEVPLWRGPKGSVSGSYDDRGPIRGHRIGILANIKHAKSEPCLAHFYWFWPFPHERGVKEAGLSEFSFLQCGVTVNFSPVARSRRH